jgi:hypothetical protein
LAWLTWFFIAVDVVLALVLVSALRRGVILATKGPEIDRKKNPKAFWVLFAAYTLILAVALFATLFW